MLAVGAYLRILRDAKGMTLGDVVRLLNEQATNPNGEFPSNASTSESQISRIERGQETRTTLFFAVVRVVGGEITTVERLLLDKNANEQEGERAALLLLNPVANGDPVVAQEEKHGTIVRAIQSLKDNDPALVTIENILKAVGVFPSRTFSEWRRRRKSSQQSSKAK